MKYTVAAFLDLRGFSNYFEAASADLRTSVGATVIERLQLLEDAVLRITTERLLLPHLYPSLEYTRLNDSIVLSLDLPDELMPSVGETIKNGWSANELNEKYGDLLELPSEDEFSERFNARLAQSVADLVLFVGLIARLAKFVNRQEESRGMPGCKCVVATGVRYPFVTAKGDDHFSANFAFANAYVAEGMLKGASVYVDSNVIRLLLLSSNAKNLVRRAWRSRIRQPLDPMAETDEPLRVHHRKEAPKPITVELFRKEYDFYQLDPHPLAYLQIVNHLTQMMPDNLSKMTTKLLVDALSLPSDKVTWLDITRFDLADEPEFFFKSEKQLEDEKRERIVDASSRYFVPTTNE
jgi:hypothetical protein